MPNKHKRSTPAPNAQTGATPRWLWFAVIIFFALAIGAGAILLTRTQPTDVTGTLQVTGQPNALIDETKFDYGDVKLGTTIETVFHVKNVGDKVLAFQGQPRVELREGC